MSNSPAISENSSSSIISVIFRPIIALFGPIINFLIPYLKGFTGTPADKDLTCVSLTATFIFMGLCAYYCSKLTRNIFIRSIRHRSLTNFLVQEILFITCLLNLWVVWIASVMLVESCNVNWAESVGSTLHKFNLKATAELNSNYFKIFLLYLFSITPILFNFVLRKFTGANRLWIFLCFDDDMDSDEFNEDKPQYTQIHFHDEHNNEIGRSAFFLRFPPSRDMQQLLTLHDYYYLQQSGRARKSRGIRKVNSLRLVYLRSHHGIESARKSKSYESLPPLRLIQDQNI